MTRIAIALLMFGACRTACPKCPIAAPPPPVTVVAPRAPCILPEIPAPLKSVGVPDADRDGYFVPRQSWAELGGYQAGVRLWIAAAAECLERP